MASERGKNVSNGRPVINCCSRSSLSLVKADESIFHSNGAPFFSVNQPVPCFFFLNLLNLSFTFGWIFIDLLQFHVEEPVGGTLASITIEPSSALSWFYRKFTVRHDLTAHFVKNCSNFPPLKLKVRLCLLADSNPSALNFKMKFNPQDQHTISYNLSEFGGILMFQWISIEFNFERNSSEKIGKFSGATGVCGSSAVQWWQRRNIPSIDDLSSCRVFVQRETVGSGSVNAGGRDRCQAKISSAANHLALFCAPRFGELFSDIFQCCSWIPPLREPRQRRVKWYFCG